CGAGEIDHDLRDIKERDRLDRWGGRFFFGLAVEKDVAADAATREHDEPARGDGDQLEGKLALDLSALTFRLFRLVLFLRLGVLRLRSHAPCPRIPRA